jgi:hypothetical protein
MRTVQGAGGRKLPPYGEYQRVIPCTRPEQRVTEQQQPEATATLVLCNVCAGQASKKHRTIVTRYHSQQQV